MRKIQKKQAEDFLKTLGQAHEMLKQLIEKKKQAQACEILKECQQGIIELGNLAEQSEGADCALIPVLEEYCELAYQIYEQLCSDESVPAGGVYKSLNRHFIKIENKVKDIKVRSEIVFFPYKASMWDSLESIWMAADADEDCDAYVVPIPYYDRNPDGTFGTFHYEGNDFPDYVPITHYDEYFIEERKPDAAYIHNPYDQGNYVTSVDPDFYSERLKKYTKCLVYVPYYVTSFGMSIGRSRCPAYYYADYIIIQTEAYRKFFDSSLPPEKLAVLGSPKLDRAVRLCSQPKQLPEAWKSKMEGKKTYFYNTSINEMLAHTQKFLKKMDYVFRCFHGREDACLVWRPHPLLEATFDSMRKNLYPAFKEMKKNFIEEAIGIYDDTPDVTETVALCDVYIGSRHSSVRSLFGIVGKPIFILNNDIHSTPEPNSWRGEIIKPFWPDGGDEWMVTQGNKLYHSPGHDYCYQYVCDLSEYSYGDYYSRAFGIGDKVYVCPKNIEEILVIADGKVEKRVQLKHEVTRMDIFESARRIDNFIFLIPQAYPAVVRYNVENDEVVYIRKHKDVFASLMQEEWKVGGVCRWENYLLLASPVDHQAAAIDIKSGDVKLLAAGSEKSGNGCLFMADDGMDIWMLPYSGMTITRWNPKSGEVRKYSGVPQNMQCINRLNGFACRERPFGMPAFCKNDVILPPYWGNMFLRLDKETGKFEEWKPPFPVSAEDAGGCCDCLYAGMFIRRTDTLGAWTYRYFDYANRKLYDINLETEEYKELMICFDQEELNSHEPGFCKISGWLRYGCMENYSNSLERLLDENITGNAFDQTSQEYEFGKIAVNHDGTCGQKVHQFICGKLQ